jgi:hypothetical protein
MSTQSFIADLDRRYFNGTLSEDFRNRLNELPVDRPDVLAFIERMFVFMKRGGAEATDLSGMQGEILGSLLARILPGAWEGRVPPITVPGRHVVIDHYVKNCQWISATAGSLMDLGCGFPPYTTLETAKFFPDWKITGGDPSLPKYLVYDAEANYATFNKDKEVVYFQPALPSIENWNALLADSASTSKGFSVLLEQLLQSENGVQQSEFPRLEIDPVLDHEDDNVSFLTGGIGQLDIAPVDVIRCFNVLFYFNDDFRENALQWFNTKLNDDGLLVLGSNWALSTESRYYVYQKSGDTLELREFAFSLDNLCPIGIVTWYTNHDDDRESAQLADYLKILRSDDEYMKKFYAFQDEIRAKYKICPRDESGYYGLPDPSLSAAELWQSAADMLTALQQSDLVQEAVGVLKASGLQAGVNEVGHVAVYTS